MLNGEQLKPLLRQLKRLMAVRLISSFDHTLVMAGKLAADELVFDYNFVIFNQPIEKRESFRFDGSHQDFSRK